MELGAALGTKGMCLPMVDFIGGLAQADITVEQIERVIDDTNRAAQGHPFKNVTWLSLE